MKRLDSFLSRETGISFVTLVICGIPFLRIEARSAHGHQQGMPVEQNILHSCIRQRFARVTAGEATCVIRVTTNDGRHSEFIDDDDDDDDDDDANNVFVGL